MKEECNHEAKTNVNDILALIPIYTKEFACKHCGKRIKMDVSKILVYIVTFFMLIFIAVFVPHIADEYLASASFFIKIGYYIPAMVGFTCLYYWIINSVIWLFRKRLKYVVIEDDDTN